MPDPRVRILLTFLGWTDGLSGGDRHLLEMGSRWRANATVDVLAPPQAAATIRAFIGEDAVVHPLGSAGRRTSARGALLAAEYTRRAVTAAFCLPRGYDVVCGASHFAADSVAVASSARRGALGVGYVYHLISERPQRDLRTRWSLLEEAVGLKLLKRHAGLVFTSNGETRRLLRIRGLESIHTDVGIDVSAFPSGTTSTRPPIGVFVGRLVASKGLVDAVEAWAYVLRQLPSARLVIVGIGPERGRAEERARELGVESAIQWRGWVSEEEKRRLLRQARVFVAPSYEEGWGISVCEALASGVPVVAYRLPTLDELFGGAYAAAPLGDVAALGSRALELLLDDASAAEFSRRGRTTAERYDLGKVAEGEFEQIIRAARRGSSKPLNG